MALHLLRRLSSKFPVQSGPMRLGLCLGAALLAIPMLMNIDYGSGAKPSLMRSTFVNAPLTKGTTPVVDEQRHLVESAANPGAGVSQPSKPNTLKQTAPLAPVKRLSLPDLAKKLGSAVVNISTAKKVTSRRRDRFGEKKRPKPFARPRQNALGTGFVIDPSGLIVTNHHVIKGADEITINFTDGTKLIVEKVIGKDPKTDVALLKVNPKQPLPFVPFGSSDKSRVGDWVMAIGNPFGLGGSVTMGIISGKSRNISNGPYDNFIQTDAAINKGNSGGPLFNMQGKVIGMNTAILSTTGGSVGIGFAVPSETVTNIIDQFKRFGETRRGWLGVRIQTVSQDIATSLGLDKAYGALVANVTPNSPAEKAGLKVGDVIIGYDGRVVPNMRRLPFMVALTPIEKPVDVEFMRDGKRQNIQVNIERLKEDDSVAPNGVSRSSNNPNGVLGLTLVPADIAARRRYRVSREIKGLIVTKIDRDSPAAMKNIAVGDVIEEIGTRKMTTVADAFGAIANARKLAHKSILLLVRKPQRGVGKKVTWETKFLALPLPAQTANKK